MPDVKSRHTCAQFGDLADVLMADDHGGLDVLRGPFVPVVDVNVRAADRGFVNFNEYLAGARYGYGNLTKLQTDSRCRLDNRVH